VGGGCRPGIGARPRLEQRSHVFGLSPPTTDLDKGPHDGSHHMAKEPVSADFIREQATCITPHGACDRAGGPAGFTARALERDEIVSPDEGRGCSFHRREIERLRQMPFERARERIRDRRVSDSILIRLPARAEARVKLRIDVGHRQHTNIGREMHVECALESRDVVIEAHDRARDLTECMDTSASSSSPCTESPSACLCQPTSRVPSYASVSLRVRMPADAGSTEQDPAYVVVGRVLFFGPAGCFRRAIRA